MKLKNPLLAAFLILKIFLQYQVVLPLYDLHRDEYLHLDQGRHLAWGYVSVPPVTSWISFIIIQLGNDVFWVKFFPALFGALTLLMVWKIIEALGGNLFALALGAAGILFSSLMRINILFQPNSLDILLWTVAYYCVVRYSRAEDRKWLYFLAVVFAIGFLNKYNIVFLLLGLAPALLLTEHRKVFLRKDFYLAMALALVLISPNLIWQYTHGFPVMHHMAELAKTQLDKVSRLDFVKEQVLFFFGVLYVLVAALIAFFTYPPFKPYRLIFWSYWFTIAIFIALRAKGYYAVGLYPVLIAFGAVYLEALLQQGWKYYLRPVLILIPALIFIPVLRIAFPIYTPAELYEKAQRSSTRNLLHRWEDGKEHALPQDFADMLGWKEMAHKTDSAWNLIGKPDETLVLCNNYGEAGAINYYSRVNSIRAVSFNADYINWFPLDRKIKNLIWVRESGDTTYLKKVQSKFSTSMEFDKVANPFAREAGTTIYVLRDAPAEINPWLATLIEQY